MSCPRIEPHRNSQARKLSLKLSLLDLPEEVAPGHYGSPLSETHLCLRDLFQSENVINCGDTRIRVTLVCMAQVHESIVKRIDSPVQRHLLRQVRGAIADKPREVEELRRNEGGMPTYEGG